MEEIKMKNIKIIPKPKCVGKRYIQLKRCLNCMIKNSCYNLYVKGMDYYQRKKKNIKKY